ncbi:MAG: hypothetical protein WC943_06485 [Elusimicrobiota bacterium]|jgi:hypothetical protein
MNKKLLGAMVAVAAVTLFWAKLVPASAEGQHGAHGKAMTCPVHVQGAEVKVANTAYGVVIEITGKEPGIIKEIQAAAASHAGMKHEACSCCGEKAVKAAKKIKGAKAGESKSQAELYVCSMGCYKGPKTEDGRCPKCGMNLEKR